MSFLPGPVRFVGRTINLWFFKIQEPRIIRLVMLAAYLWTIYTGIMTFTQSPDEFYAATGPNIVFSIGGFFIVGGMLGAYAVLPGKWYIEKMGLTSIGFALAARAILIVAINGTQLAFNILVLCVFFLVVRWLSIKKYDLAASTE